ncbi:tetratricopeptide repeat protein [Dactylosporangium siamense]|uniref:Tetratricopeptide repeat protein n=1 Tax=Dactylosporangium siamense TaxID=685454 RepID=A0A919PY36_9ACTN|nr:tetratricopeptide repeat protein [Dactylosporangium siamense]GIG52890.1 hypothetical protein Dsi01nite_109310 [Dactylosporangium siamense]
MKTEQPTWTRSRYTGPLATVTGDGRHAAPKTPRTLVDQAGALLAAYDFTGAYQLLVEVRSLLDHGVIVEDVDAVDATRMLADTLLAMGQPDRAADLVAELAARPGLGPYQSAMLIVTQARLLTAQDQLDEAAACYRDIIDCGTGGRERMRWPVLLATAGAGGVTAAQGRPATAEPALTAAYARLSEEYGTSHTDVVRVGVELVQVRKQTGGDAAAARLAARLLPAATAGLGQHHPLIVELDGYVDDRTVQPRGRERAPGAAPSVQATASPAAPSRGPSPHCRGTARRRSLPYWALVAAAMGPAAAAATTAPVLAITTFLPARTPGAVAQPPTQQAAVLVAARSFWSPSYPAAGGVRIIRDSGTTIDVAWTDPTGGTRPTILFLTEDDTPPVVAATVQAATTSHRLTGLNRRARRYCISVAIAYSTTTLARAPDVCTSRPAPATSNTRAGIPPNSTPATSTPRPATTSG